MYKLLIMIALTIFIIGCGSEIGDDRHTVIIEDEISMQENLDLIADGTSDISIVDAVKVNQEQESFNSDEVGSSEGENEINKVSDMVYTKIEGIE